MKGLLREKVIQATERHLGVALPYMRELARVTPELLPRLRTYNGMAQYAKHVPAEIRHLAALGATRAQDCGACVQIGVNPALKEGVSPHLLQAVVEGAEAALTEEQRDAVAFGEAVTLQDPVASDLREAMRARYGDEGLVAVSWAVACSQFYPTLKRGMGFAESAAVFGVTVEG